MADILELCMNGYGCCDCEGNQSCFREAGMEISRLRYEVAKITLTAEEREAIEIAISCMYVPDVHHLTPPAKTPRATLRSLLARLA